MFWIDVILSYIEDEIHNKKKGKGECLEGVKNAHSTG